MNHLPHSTGQVWPLIYRRVIMGLLLFQLTMAGTLAGYHNGWILSMMLIPAPLITLSYMWDFEKNYIPLIKFIALSSIRDFERIEFTRESSRLESVEGNINSDSSSSSIINTDESSLEDDFEFTDLLATDFLPVNRRFRSQSISYLAFMKFTDAVTDNDVDDINSFNNYKYSTEIQDYSYPLLTVPLTQINGENLNSPELQRYTDEQV